MSKPLIERERLFADQEKNCVKLSPDGQTVSFLAPVNGILNLWVAPLSEVNAAKPLTQSKEPIHDYAWSAQGDWLLYLHDQQGDENWELKGIQLSNQQHKNYTPKGAQARIIQISQQHPHQIAIVLNQRHPALHDLYTLDLITGDLKCQYENNQYWEFLVDHDFKLRVGIKIDTVGGCYDDLSNPTQPKTLVRLSQLDMLALYYYPAIKMGFATDNQTLYVSDSLKTNTAALCAINTQDGSKRTLGRDPKADLYEVLFDPKTKQPQAFAVLYDRKQWTVLDQSLAGDFETLQALNAGDLNIVGQSSDNLQWIVSYTHDNGPTHFYHYNRKVKVAKRLFDSSSQLKDLPLTRMHPKIVTTHDNLQCMNYLSIPKEQDTKGNGIPKEPLPMILLVHGGPHYRDFWGFNPWHQWLADRGYAVLSVNYRSSTGFGKNHMRAGNGEWAGKIQQDLIDAKNWAVKNHIAIEDKVAVMGRSFGGYVTLAAMSMTPDEFCCGIDLMGFANLETQLAHFPPYWKAVKKAFVEMLGCDPDTQEGIAFLKERSPIHYADRIKHPLLIEHGGNDPRVLQCESDQMVAAMQKNKLPVTYVLFPDEGHQINHLGNREAFHALAEAFLAKNLGGQCLPPANNIQTSMEVMVDDFNLCAKAGKAS